ncbi:MAG: lipase family protein [Cyanobacteriota bacterium]|nr:lipase family protein [Cyanobacteriota bacterium]
MTVGAEAKAVESEVLKFGDTIYLQHLSGRYVCEADRGRRNWPQLGSSEAVKLQILPGNDEEKDLVDGAVVKLKSSEPEVGDRDILGNFGDSHDCYYWLDNYSVNKQSWRMTKKNRSGDKKIRYGDDVYFTNLHYKNQNLSRDPRYSGYLATILFANEWWTLKAAVDLDECGISAEAALLQRRFEPETRKFSAANMAYLAYCAEAVYRNPEDSKMLLEQLGFEINGTEHFIDFPDTNTQAIAVGDDEKIIIAFRGTENLDDWKTNINLAKAVWKVGMVHSGFYNSIQSVWPTAIARLESLRTKNQPIWLTGHSLGGALATLASATIDNELPDYEIAGIYTFGQPRVGDGIFSKFCDERTKERYFRAVNNNDIVPRIPQFRYTHSGTLLYFDALGNMYSGINLSPLNPLSWYYRFQGYFQDSFNLDPDDVGDHRMGNYRILTMRQLEEAEKK